MNFHLVILLLKLCFVFFSCVWKGISYNIVSLLLKLPMYIFSRSCCFYYISSHLALTSFIFSLFPGYFLLISAYQYLLLLYLHEIDLPKLKFQIAFFTSVLLHVHISVFKLWLSFLFPCCFFFTFSLQI